MSYWLLKSEPADWSWQNQCSVPIEPWTGVRNYQARQYIRAMQPDDLCFFYHSSPQKRIVGIVRVTTTAYPDPTDTHEVWDCVDVTAVAPLPKPVTLTEMKADPALTNLTLLRQSRLSVVPISAMHWTHICTIGQYTGNIS